MLSLDILLMLLQLNHFGPNLPFKRLDLILQELIRQLKISVYSFHVFTLFIELIVLLEQVLYL